MAAIDWVAYYYKPSKVGAGVFAGVFALVTAVATFQMVRLLRKDLRSKAWSIMPFIAGGACEAIGYIGRIISADKPTEPTTGYIMQSILLLIAPALFSATIYMALGLVVRALHAEQYSVIRLKWLTKLFVIGDVLAFFIQSGGGGIMSNGDNVTLGENIIIAGLFVQIAFFGLFMVVMAIFTYRIKQQPTSYSLYYLNYPSMLRNWRMVLATLFLCSIFIFIRSLVRCVEFIQGNNGYIITHEIYLFIFDGALMCATMVAFVLEDPITYYFQMMEELQRTGSVELDPASSDKHGAGKY